MISQLNYINLEYFKLREYYNGVIKGQTVYSFFSMCLGQKVHSLSLFQTISGETLLKAEIR